MLAQAATEILAQASTKNILTLQNYPHCHHNFRLSVSPINGLSNKVYVLRAAKKTLQELRMLSSVTLDCQVTNIVMNSGSQL